MNEKEMRDFLEEAISCLEDLTEEEERETKINRIETFKDAGILTMDEGLVLKMKDGTKFYLTIKQG